ncbi:MAG TPA: DoxX family protein [Puia sp.]|uniref:DoxX family protein n=1 Tax=Puia sp. TaxID=2045100 RepID=UPI002CE23D13|nr:DoxX family protein [Puia sp.]HVU97672.1 DoxX family protein [Puia sp.]
MKLKTLTILYWIFTILFAALMLFSAVGGIKPTDAAIKVMHDGMGYPVYFISFISIAKLLGCIAILIPGLVRVKEWAYAGLFFDLAGAIYSNIAVEDKFDPAMLSLLIWVAAGVLSYYYWRRRMAWAGDPDRIVAATPALGQ